MFPLQGGMPTNAINYVDDVFSTYTYTGTGSAQTITNSIDLSGKGGMVWMKSRDTTADNAIYDTTRGATFELGTNLNTGQVTQASGLTAFNSNGFTIGGLARINTSLERYASWSFRKAAKFFDIVTYTGNGVASTRTINHSLGIAPGMIIVKRSNSTGTWYTYHNGTTNANWYLAFNTAAAQTGDANVFPTTPTSTRFDVSGTTSLNISGATYVAYLFAHDTSSTGIIQCGSYVGNGATDGVLQNLGWEPQFLIVKEISTTGSWWIIDSMRGLNSDAYCAELISNTPITAEAPGGSHRYLKPHAQGFVPYKEGAAYTTNDTGVTYGYVAIRRPNKPPTSGTSVLEPVLYTGNSGAQTITTSTLRAPDLFWAKWRTGTPGNSNHNSWDRLRGVSAGRLFPNLTSAEETGSAITSFNMTGVTLNTNYANTSSTTYVGWFFRRARGVFDQVCYSGTSVADTKVHNLGIAPELIIVKCRNQAAREWVVGATPIGWTGSSAVLFLEQNVAVSGVNYWNSTAPTATVFSLGTSPAVNATTLNYIAYLFATVPGVSKVGSFTGNGTSQTINAGFTTGARYILIKRTDAAGNWYVWDSSRGIVAANDPYLIVNSTVAEAADDSVDPDNSGFIVNQVAATNINITSATYIYLAIA